MNQPEFLCMRCMSQLPEPQCVCPNCGFDNVSAHNEAHQLECGSILAGTYLVGCVLGQGGFGITYIGWDLNLDTKVAIKEYYPEGFVTRDMHTHVFVLTLSGEKDAYFQNGKERFINEAKTLAKFADEPGIVGVRSFFHENGTAYIVMDFIEGETLKSYVARRGGKLPSAEVLELFKPLFRSLARVHEAGLLHRDISPDNIMLRTDGTPVLLDFGAARQMSIAGEHSNTINVKHGFAPEEQYRTHGTQGPWTDVYALCATIYRLTTGVTPPQALDRLTNEAILIPPNRLGADFTSAQEQAIMHGLAVHAADRTPDMRRLGEELFSPAAGRPAHRKAKRTPRRVAWIAAAAVCAAACLALVWATPRGNGGTEGSLQADEAIAASATTDALVSAPAEAETPALTAAPRSSLPATAVPTAIPSPTPARLTVATARTGIVAAGSLFTVALKADGSVVSIGDSSIKTSGWSNIVQVAASGDFAVGLCADGHAVATGKSYQGECDLGEWEDIIQIDCGYQHTVGLSSTGKIYYAGFNQSGRNSCTEWTNISKLLAGSDHLAGIRSDGTVIAAGYNKYGQCNTDALTNVVDGDVGGGSTFCILSDGTVAVLGKNWAGEDDVQDWTDIVAISAAGEHTVGLRADGTVVAVGSNNYGECDVSGWTDIVAVAAGGYHTVGVKSDGTLVATGSNNHGQCSVSGIKLW